MKDKAFTVGDCTIQRYVFDDHDAVQRFIRKRDQYQRRYACYASSGRYYAEYYAFFPDRLYTAHFYGGGFQQFAGKKLQNMLDTNAPMLERIARIS